MLRDYYTITKPGIIYGNTLTIIAGFLLASHGTIDYLLLSRTLIGLSLIIASGCVINNYIDRDIDALMERTKNRALVVGTINPLYAILYGVLLGMTGLAILVHYTNHATITVAILGVFVYIALYSMWLKRSSTHGNLVGAISGAVPILVGYLAVQGTFNLEAMILFCILVTWQMPHALAIGIYRLNDYTAAGVQTLPVKKGVQKTKRQMPVYTVLFAISILMLSVYNYTGILYLYSMTPLVLVWFLLSVKGLYIKSTDEKMWARRMFLFSIVILVVFCVTASIDSIL